MHVKIKLWKFDKAVVFGNSSFVFDHESFAVCNESFVVCNESSGVRFYCNEKSLSLVFQKVKLVSLGNCKVLYLWCFVEVLSFV